MTNGAGTVIVLGEKKPHVYMVRGKWHTARLKPRYGVWVLGPYDTVSGMRRPK